jgi:RHS repeat-associated protein
MKAASDETKQRRQRPAGPAGFVILVIALWASSSAVWAQGLQMHCPGSGCLDTNAGCTNYQLIWDVPCGCSGGQFYPIQCSGPGVTGSLSCPGSLYGDCTYTCSATVDYSQICPVPNPEPPPASPPRKQKPAPPSPPCPTDAGGKPIRFTTGDMFFTQTDAVVGELSVTRTFSSGRVSGAGRYGAFGPGWNASFEQRLNVLSANTIEARASDGAPSYYFDDNADGLFEAALPYSKESSIQASGGGYQLLFRAGGSEAYDSTGRLTTATDPAGVVTTYARDSLGRLASVSRLGRTVTVEYEGTATSPSRLLDGQGVVLASYSYSGDGRLGRVAYPDGGGYEYAYDPGGRVVRVVDLGGTLVEAHEYDASGRALTSEVGNGVEKQTVTYGAGQTTVTDALGNMATYEYANVHGLLRVTRVTGPCTSCGGSGAGPREWTYDEAGNITSYKDGAGKTTTYTYDPSTFDLLSETNALNQTTTYTYDTQGRLLTQSGPDGSLTTYTHGPSGPLTMTQKVTGTESRTTTLTYTSLGKPETTTDPRNGVTTLAYNSSGDLTSVTDPLDHAASFGYDGRGLRTTVTDALGHTTTTAYDARGRVTRVTNPDDTHTDFTYDAGGRRTSVTDPMERTTSYVYDPYGRLKQVVDPMSGVTAYGYDVMSRLTSLTDAKGHATAFEYDEDGHVKKLVYPGGAFESFAYDAAGRLSTRTDRKTVVTTYTYDDLGRLTGKTYSDGTTPPVTYTYDTAGRLATAANGTDTLTWTYDLAGQLLSEQSQRNASTVAYTYDAAGNRSTVSLDGSLFVSYGYDDASRLTTITRGANVFSFGYDDANRRTSLGFPNGVNTTYTYDTLNRLTNLAAILNGTTTITSFGYTHDSVGNRLSKAQPDHTETYGYDRLSRLTEVRRTGSLTGVATYSYDAVGNRLTLQQDGAVITSTFNEKNQLTSSASGGLVRWRGTLDEPGTVTFTAGTVNGRPARLLPANIFEADLEMAAGTNTVTIQATDASGNVATKSYSVDVTGTGASYSYDSNANLTSKTEGPDTWTYTWNAENQLAKVEKNGAEVARFAYDPLGRRVGKVASGVTTTFTYDSDAILREVQGVSTQKYIHGPGLDEPLAVDDGTALTHLHSDALGSVTRTTNTAGVIALARQYDAWGNLEAGATEPGYAFTGREWDPDTGLYYYRARYYDPRAARFISEDPIGFWGGEVDLYSYVRGQPIDLSDPFGLAATGGKRADPYQPTVVCRNGQVDVFVPTFSAGAEECGIGRCIRKHEEQHKCDITKSDPDICRGVADDTLIVPSSESERKAREAGGMAAEVECLAQEATRTPATCKQRQDCRLKQLNCWKTNGFNFAACRHIKCGMW